MSGTAVLKQSNGSTTVSSTLSAATTRALVKAGIAVPIAGADITSVKSTSGANDTAIASASPSAPIKLGVDDITFKPLQYPEPTNV
jgi:hypothetical protein